jgi:membrane protein implicated in regulation of membrane protease activity
VPERPRLPAEAVVIAAVALCCALPVIVVVIAGVIASGWGAALRLWPVSVAGLLLLGVGGVALVRRVHSRTEKPFDREETSR